MTKRRWLIVSADGMFWSNHYGWCEEKHLASDFDDTQRVTYMLPPQGAWREMEDTPS